MKTIKTSICCALVAIFLCFGLIPAYAVIGGYDAMPGDWPFMVSVQQDGNHRVGGVLREFTENKLPNFKIIPSYYKVL
ncbi:MAG: hypothetical protein LWX55_09125 [Deltaproteobacteria bacterium]|jgi:hypothetical protein|nr:hypothetical protein [Deltaproteobacteria bacterium]